MAKPTSNPKLKLLGFNNLDDGFYTVALVPEPSSALVGAGVALTALHRRRRHA